MNCYDNEKCIKGQCQSGCSSNDHCEHGFNCFQGSCMKSCESSQNCHQGHNCHSDHECETESGPEPGRPCVFPFMYKGVRYNECTSVEWDQPWCAVEVDNYRLHIKGKWGNCKKTCNKGKIF